MPLRIPDLLDATATRHPTLTAMRVRRDGRWHETSWDEYREQARLVARGFIALGLPAGGCVTITGGNRPEWYLADVGAILAGGVPAGIYATSSAEQCAWITAHCDATIAVVDDARQLAKFESVRAAMPALRAIVVMDEVSDAADPAVVPWSRLLALGETVGEAELDARIAAQRAEDLCTLIYTSGTTGQPKGVMLSHDNITWTTGVVGRELGIRAGDQAVSYLPLSHIAEQVTTLFGSMMYGACISFVPSMDDLGDVLREVRPHYFLGVPRVWEKIQERIEAVGRAGSPLRKRIARWARRVGLAGGYASQEGRPIPFTYSLADRVVFGAVKRKLGMDRARILATAAAPIAKSTLEFFLSLGMPICEVYGMSECTGPGTISSPTRYRTGRAGWCVPGAEIRVAEDGEICMRGRHVFLGYYKDPVATADAIDADGWLHSGDIGVIDAEGWLSVTDRKKELIITAGGENVAPQLVESHLKAIPVVSQAVVVGDRRRYLAVLLTLDPEKVPEVAAQAGSPALDPASASTCATFRAWLDREIAGVNARLAHVQTVKRFAVLPGELTPEGGELTPTMKLRRKVILEKYASVIERLYEGQAGG